MVHILAASSLHHAVNSLPYSSKKQFLGKVTCSRILLQQKFQKLVQREKSPSEGSSEQEEGLGSVARPDKQHNLTSQVKQLPTLQRAGVDIVS